MHVDCTDSIHLLCSSVEPGVVGVRDWATGIHFAVGVGGVQAGCLRFDSLVMVNAVHPAFILLR
jgi:hypothetical protein